MVGIGGSIPQMNRNPEGYGIKRLFFSVRDIALIKDKTVQGGYGVLKAGTILAKNVSDAGDGKGKLVPYVPLYDDVVINTDTAIGVSFLLQDAASGTIKISINDSYRYNIGDDLYLDNSSGEGPTKAAAITAITRTDPRWAVITTSGFSHGNYTVAKGAYVYVQTSESGDYTAAAYVLDKDIDTGVGVEAKGALTSVVLSNAILYKNSLVNATAEALTSLGAVEDGQHIILK